MPASRCNSPRASRRIARSEEHTSELQSQSNLVCRLLLEKKENAHVQRAQHEILLSMINEKDLATDLHHRGQLAPIDVTKYVYVVDGNRRLDAPNERTAA